MVQFNTNREIRLSPKKDFNYLLWFFGGILFLIITTEIMANTNAEYFRGQSRVLMVMLILFVYRIFTINTWAEHYKESLNYFFKSKKIDSYIRVSIFNVLFDIFIISCLLIWIDIEKISFIRIPYAGLVYVLMIGFSALKRKKKSKS